MNCEREQVRRTMEGPALIDALAPDKIEPEYTL